MRGEEEFGRARKKSLSSKTIALSTAGNLCRVQGSRCRVQGAGCRVQGSGSMVQGAGFGVQGSGCRGSDLCFAGPAGARTDQCAWNAAPSKDKTSE